MKKTISKRFLSLAVVVAFLLSLCSVSALAAAPARRVTPRASVFDTTVTLAPGERFQSYQYEIASSRTAVYAEADSWGNSTGTLTFQGASSVGGTRTNIDSVTIPANSSQGEFPPTVSDYPRQFKYYNIVLVNTGSVSCTYHVAIGAD